MNARPIEGFPGYVVADSGFVYRRAIDGGFFTVATSIRTGYVRARMRGACGLVHRKNVHVLVLEAFVGPRPSTRHHAAHFPDADRTNNRLDNLVWKTPEENERDKRSHGTQPKGGRRTPTSEAAIAMILLLHAEGESYTAIARRLGLHRTSVQRILTGKRRAA